MDDRVVPSVWASVRYQDGMREDLFAEDPVSLLGKSDKIIKWLRGPDQSADRC